MLKQERTFYPSFAGLGMKIYCLLKLKNLRVGFKGSGKYLDLYNLS